MEQRPILRRGLLTLIALSLVALSVVVVKTSGQEPDRPDRPERPDRWEYLIVAGPSTTNFSPTSIPNMRKETNGSFGREGFVLQQHMDKLGASGWELVTVAGTPADPVFYFKRLKPRR